MYRNRRNVKMIYEKEYSEKTVGKIMEALYVPLKLNFPYAS